MAKKKFDTNPLDPTFPERVQEEAETVSLPKTPFKTAEFPPPSVTEEQTRQFDTQRFSEYQAPYNGQNVPTNFNTNRFANVNDTNSRKVNSIGLPENILTALPYIPFSIGFIAGLIILFLVPKSEAKSRFHAAQGLAAHIGIWIITIILKSFDNFIPFAGTANEIFWLVTTIMLIIFAIKAYRGKPIHIEAVDSLTEWLEDKIKPQR